MKTALYSFLFILSFNAASQVSQDSSVQYYDLLTNAIDTGIQRFDLEPIVLVQYPSQGGLKWYYQNINDIFNQGTFDIISARIKPSSYSDFLVEFSSSGGFPNAYSAVLMNIYYAQSPKNLAEVKKSMKKSAGKSRELVQEYQQNFGKISEQQMDSVSALTKKCIKTKVDYIIDYEMSVNWSGINGLDQYGLSLTTMEKSNNLIDLLKNEPANAVSTITLAQSYLKLNSSINTLMDSVSIGNWILRQLRTNSTDPNEDNGGMKTIDPVTGGVSESYQVGYGVGNSIPELVISLKSERKNVKINLTIDKPNPISVNVVTEMSHRTDTINYELADSMVQIALPFQMGTITKGEVNMEYYGIVDFDVMPENWNEKEGTGWYWGYPITQAVANLNDPKGGYTFAINPQFNFDSLSLGGNFGFIESLLLCDSTVSSILAFEMIVPNSDSISNNQGSIIRMSNSKSEESKLLFQEQLYPKIEVPTLQQTANVIGGRFSFPGVPYVAPND